MQPGIRRFRQASLLLGHGSIALIPPELPKSSGIAITATCAFALLLVIRMTTTSPATNVGGFLLLAHTRCTL